MKLLTWWEFQKVFLEQWYKKNLSLLMSDEFDRLDDYLSPAMCVEGWYTFLEKEEKSRFEALQAEYSFLLPIFYSTFPHMQMLHPDLPLLSLPLNGTLGYPKQLPEGLVACAGYREFFDELCAFCEPVFQKFLEIEMLGRNRMAHASR